jgi:hypothetical protein
MSSLETGRLGLDVGKSILGIDLVL